MDDLTLTKACAEMMGLRYAIRGNIGGWGNESIELLDVRNESDHYDPLHDDAQCFALVKFLIRMGRLHITDRGIMFDPSLVGGWAEPEIYPFDADTDLNRAIVECVAKMKG